jgi:hypothetical protein
MIVVFVSVTGGAVTNSVYIFRVLLDLDMHPLCMQKLGVAGRVKLHTVGTYFP